MILKITAGKTCSVPSPKLTNIFLRSDVNCRINRHWQPFIANCKYCTIPYTVIGKMETMEQDLHFISKMAGLDLKLAHKFTSSGGSTSELGRKYFKELSADIVMELYILYQIDFEMFGYSVEPFL